MSCCASSESDPYDPDDLHLSVDVRFQELATRLLGDQRGAVVAIEPSTGRILALVSTPGYDPGRLVDPVTARSYLASLDRDESAPLLDRATQGRYVPGSVFKLVTAAAGLESGAIDTDTTFADQPAESRNGFRLDGFRIRDASARCPARPSARPVRGDRGVQQHLVRACRA